MENIACPIWEKYTLSFEEAAKYFGIGETKLRALCAEDDSLIVRVGNHCRIKRRMMEEYIDRTIHL